MTLGERIRDYRILKGLTQQELAEKIGLADRSSITKIEKSDRPVKMEQIVDIANALDVSTAELVGGYDSLELSLIFESLPAERKQDLMNYARYLHGHVGL